MQARSSSRASCGPRKGRRQNGSTFTPMQPGRRQFAGRSAAALRQRAGRKVSQQCSAAKGKWPEVGLELRGKFIFEAKAVICAAVPPPNDGGLRPRPSRIANVRNRTAAEVGRRLKHACSQRRWAKAIARARRSWSNSGRRRRSLVGCEPRCRPQWDERPFAQALVQPPKKARAKCGLPINDAESTNETAPRMHKLLRGFASHYPRRKRTASRTSTRSRHP